jgi:hypothetical protein
MTPCHTCGLWYRGDRCPYHWPYARLAWRVGIGVLVVLVVVFFMLGCCASAPPPTITTADVYSRDAMRCIETHRSPADAFAQSITICNHTTGVAAILYADTDGIRWTECEQWRGCGYVEGEN